MQILIPLSPEKLGGPFVTVGDDDVRILADRNRVVILELYDVPKEIDWFEDFEMLYCQRQHDSNIVKVIRRVTDEELELYRIPIWIQSDAVPTCCGRSMFFVGQIDDDRICVERPTDAKLWWHDRASFYVFTCGQCLGCKAVGQQF